MIAKALKKGDKIGVIAPCDPLGKNDIEYINKFWLWKRLDLE